MLFRVFCHTRKRLDKKTEENFEFYDVENWITNNDNTHKGRYLKK